jgi:glucosamine 6-phosphate synthetase-like amidotransferase/phosphosugar isomerase protein
MLSQTKVWTPTKRGDVIENLPEAWLVLDTQTEGEIFFTNLNRYLEIDGISPLDALTLTIKRLQSYFAVMVLFAKEDLLMVARRGHQLAIGVGENVTYFSSDAKDFVVLSSHAARRREFGSVMSRSVN